MVRLTDRLDMTIVVDWDVKPQIKQTSSLGDHDYLMSFPLVNGDHLCD